MNTSLLPYRQTPSPTPKHPPLLDRITLRLGLALIARTERAAALRASPQQRRGPVTVRAWRFDSRLRLIESQRIDESAQHHPHL